MSAPKLTALPDVWAHKDGSAHSADGPLGCFPCANERRNAPKLTAAQVRMLLAARHQDGARVGRGQSSTARRLKRLGFGFEIAGRFQLSKAGEQEAARLKSEREASAAINGTNSFIDGILRDIDEQTAAGRAALAAHEGSAAR